MGNASGTGLPARHIVLCGYTGFNNLGDELLIAALVQQLVHVSQALHQPLKVTILTQTPAETLVWLAPYAGNLTLNTAHRMNGLAVAATLAKADGLIVGGGGLFQDVSGLGSPVYYGGLITLARLLGCKVACWSQGIGPLNTAIGQWFAKQSLALASPIGVRDTASAHWVRQHVGHAPAPSTDAVWAFHPQQTDTTPATQEHSSTKPNSTFAVGLSLRPTPTWAPQHVDALLTALAKQLAPHPAVTLYLLNAHPTLDTEPLTHAADTLQQRHPNVAVVWVDCHGITEALANCQQVVAMRFHVLMAAATAHPPTLGLVYDPKVADLCQKVGLPAILPGHPLQANTHWQQNPDKVALQGQQQLAARNTDVLAAFLAKLA